MTIKKGLRELIIELGKNYTIKNIDFEYCGYRDFGEYDVEISGANNNKKKKMDIRVYVWEKINGFAIVHKSNNIENLDMLKQELEKIETTIKNKGKFIRIN